jgi:segregation and condensation protein A
MAGTALPFDESESRTGESLIVDVDGFEGPLDLLLSLARDQKVDLLKISVVKLADQYLAFVQRVCQSDLDLAAEYLVVAAWLAFLKSRLLLPPREEEQEDPPSAEDLARNLAYRLKRLETIQKLGAKLLARPRLGHAVFGRGQPEAAPSTVRSVLDVGLNDLLHAYADHIIRTSVRTLHIEAADLWSVDDAIRHMEKLLGYLPDWSQLTSFVPTPDGDALKSRSATAATFVAALELTRQGKTLLRQDGGPFAPIFVKGASQ